MTDFLRSIEGGQNTEGGNKTQNASEAGISSAVLKKQLKKLGKGIFNLFHSINLSLFRNCIRSSCSYSSTFCSKATET